MNRNGIGVGVEVKLIYYGVGCTNVLRKSRGTYGTIKKNLDRTGSWIGRRIYGELQVFVGSGWWSSRRRLINIPSRCLHLLPARSQE